MKLDELPIYTECIGNKTYVLERLEPNPVTNIFMDSVRPIRTQAQEVLTLSQKHALKYQSKLSSFTTSIAKTIRDEPVILARLGFVVSCSLGGWVLGYKGRSFRKLVYASICGSVATVVSFPNGSLSNLKYAFDIGSNKFSKIAERFNS
uniref:MICOS complex subunit n=2 Tax=Schistosoma mansoni TaxID=6183 RepID=A0A3Q0KQA6_SCHMA